MDKLPVRYLFYKDIITSAVFSINFHFLYRNMNNCWILVRFSLFYIQISKSNKISRRCPIFIYKYTEMFDSSKI